MPKFSSSKTSAFALPEHLARKADPKLISADEQQFEAIQTSLTEQIAELSARLDATRKQPGGRGQAALDRDQEIHRITARLRALRRFGLDLCLGRMVTADSSGTGLRRQARIDRQRRPASSDRLALARRRALLRSDPRQPDGTGEPSQVPLDPEPTRG